MGAKINYIEFLKEFDERLEEYFNSFGDDICCKCGCSDCCEKGDYPLSDIELEYLMHGYMNLEPEVKIQIQDNIKKMEKGGICPFLINKCCSIYQYRPIVCRVHGLAYFCKDKKVKLPYCVNNGKNFSKNYRDNIFCGNPITTNLDTPSLLEGSYAEIRSLYDWLNKKNL